MLRAALSGLRGVLPVAVGENVDELGLLISILLSVVTFLHFLARLLDSSSAKRQRLDLSKAVAMDRQIRTLSLENAELKKCQSTSATDGVVAAAVAAEKVKLETALQDMREDRAEIDDRRAALDVDLKATRAQLKEAKAEASKAREGSQTSQGEADELRSRLNSTEAELKEYRATVERVRDEAEAATKAQRKLAADADKTAAKLAELEESLSSRASELAAAEEEAETLRSRSHELEGEVHGLKTIVEKLQLASGGAESGESNGWSDLGHEDGESEEKKRERLAQLTNAAQLHGQLKQAKGEVERAKAAAQKEADARVKLELRLKEAAEEASGRGDKLERTEQERSDLLKQVTQLTGMISSKETESGKQKSELQSRVEALGKANKELSAELEHQKEKRAVWEEKFEEKEDHLRQLRKDYDRKELKFFHELKDKESRIRQLDMQNLQIRRHMAISTGGGGPDASFEMMGGMGHGAHGHGPASNNSSEAEMRELMSMSAEGRSGLSPAPGSATAADGWMLGSKSGGGAAAWGSIPSAASRRWDDRYDSPPSSNADFGYGAPARRSKRDKSRGRRSEVGSGTDAAYDEERRNKRRSRSRGARSEAAPPTSGSPDGHKVPRRHSSRTRSRGGPSPVDAQNPYPVEASGFDPIYGGGAPRRNGGPSPPPILAAPSPPLNPNVVQPAPTKRGKGEKKKTKRDRD